MLYEGDYTVYQFLELNQKSSVLSFIASYYLWQGKWLEPAISHQHEKESLLHHFSDCPELEYKIKTDEYGLNEIKAIIEEYVNCDLTDDYEFFYE